MRSFDVRLQISAIYFGHLASKNKKDRASSEGGDYSHQRHALSLAARVRCEHGA